MIERIKKIPLYTINGPLGAGKTTLLKHLLTLPQFATARLIENEFANVSVDSAQLHAHDKPVVTIAGECICCSTGDELVDALDMFAASPAPVIIEATGMADSLQLFEKLAAKGVFDRYELRCNFFVYDAAELASGRALTPGVVAEFLAADVVLVTKCDLLTETSMAVVTRIVGGTDATAVHYVSHGIPALGELPTASGMAEFYLANEFGERDAHVAAAYTVIDTTDATFDPVLLQRQLEGLVTSRGLRRAKGDFCDTHGNLVHIEMTPTQCVCEPTDRLATGIVLIGDNVQALTLRDIGGVHAAPSA
jgi:G3E family GTPase